MTVSVVCDLGHHATWKVQASQWAGARANLDAVSDIARPHAALGEEAAEEQSGCHGLARDRLHYCPLVQTSCGRASPSPMAASQAQASFGSVSRREARQVNGKVN